MITRDLGRRGERVAQAPARRRRDRAAGAPRRRRPPALERSTPAAAQTKPWRVSQIRNAPRRRTMRALSPQDQLDHARIGLVGGDLPGARRRPTLSSATLATLDLRDRLLRHAHDVAVAQAAGTALAAAAISRPAEVVARRELGEPAQRDDRDVAHGRASAARATDRAARGVVHERRARRPRAGRAPRVRGAASSALSSTNPAASGASTWRRRPRRPRARASRACRRAGP